MRSFKVYTNKNIDNISQLKMLDAEVLEEMKAVADVLPFRVNDYVIDNLIDWNNIPDDPIYQMVFPQPGMLCRTDLNQILDARVKHNQSEKFKFLINEVRQKLNPHPAGQVELNMPTSNGIKHQGIQHKYKDTMLFFPKQGQTCHSYCTFCFRWAQFIGGQALRFANQENDELVKYAGVHKELTDIIFSGGDPMIMKTRVLEKYLEPFFTDQLDHIVNIRLGTKALSYWPQRFVTDDDADELLKLIERLIKFGKHVTIMAHYNHWMELEPAIAKEAIRRIQSTGTIIRSQGPLLAHINDSSKVWRRLWKEQVKLGIVPYYMFIERDTGPRNYFEKSLVDALDIYNDAINGLSGLCHTVRGPSMSALEGKVKVEGVFSFNKKKLLLLRYLRARDESWVGKLFAAKYNNKATWLDQLTPASKADEIYFPMHKKLQRNLTEDKQIFIGSSPEVVS